MPWGRSTADDAAWARSVRKRALRSGRIVRPEKCEDCGAAAGPMADGRAGILAVSPDLSKPLDVRWVCRGCMEPYIRRRFGPENHASKLSMVKAREIRRRAAEGAALKALAREYGVWERAVVQIVKNQTWREL